MEIMTLLYENSEPKGDFNKLIDQAEINERGEKVIPFNDYEIEGTKLDEIVNETIKKYKLDYRTEKSMRFNIYLGASPRSKREKSLKH
jgi:hypothetical protein